MAKVVVKKTTIKRKDSKPQRRIVARSVTINGSVSKLKANAISVKGR